MRIKQLTNLINLALTLVIALLLSSCNELSDSGSAPVETRSQVLQIRMHDLPISGEEVEKVIVGITGLEVHHAELGWMSVPFEAQRYDLLELQNGTSVIIFEQPLELGKYTQIRLHVSENNELYIGGQSYSLRVPSGEQTGVKLITPFEIERGKMVEVTLDFNVQRSVKIVRDQGFLKPVIKVESIVEYDGAGLITTEGGYVSSFNGDFNIAVPANATSGTIVLSMNEVNPATLPGPLPENTILVGRVYDLEPEGYTFSTDVTLEIPYDEAAISQLGAEEDLFVVTYNEDLDLWEPVPTTVITSANVVQAQLSHFSIYALALITTAPVIDWVAEYSDGTVTLVYEPLGRLIFEEDGSARAITRTPVSTVTPSETQYTNRPTLFVSLCGAALPGSLGGSGTCSWQGDLDTRLLSETVTDYQYKHFAVDWNSYASNLTQVKDLAGVIKDFLGARQYSWDVVLVGHSRGGVFAHDLSEELVGHGKINNLHTFLLDPTAAPLLMDFYPAFKPDALPTVHYGTLLYDNQYWIDYSSTGTIADQDIPGYTNYERRDYFFPNTNHGDFPDDWIGRTEMQSLQQALLDIMAVKDSGVFYLDGSTGMEAIRISRPDDFSFEGGIEYDGDNVRIWGELTVGGIPTTVDASFGEDGIQVGGAVGLAGSSQLVITEDRIVISQSTFLNSYYASIGNGEISTSIDLSVLRNDITIDSDEISWELTVGGESISGDVPVELLFPGVSLTGDLIDGAGDFIDDVGDFLGGLF